MAGHYFYARGDKGFGPFSGSRLKELASGGRLQPTDVVWKEGKKKGVRAGTVQDLFPSTPAADGPNDTAVARTTAPAPAATQEAAAEPLPPVQSLVPTEVLLPIEEDQAPLAAPPPAEPEKKSPAQPPASPARPPDRKRRAEAVRGAIIVNQDGTTVYFKKKCSKCGHESTTKNSMPIRTGSTTSSFFCPKCKKLGQVVIRGSA